MARHHSPLFSTGFALALVWGVLGAPADAQDYRVSTTVSQYDVAEAQWVPVSTSLTWFHANKAYDYLEKFREVMIVDRVQSRFVILSMNGSNLATSLQFSELQQYLKVAMAETLGHVQQLPMGQRRDALAFQLQPEFEKAYDPTTGTLSLRGPLIRYEVETVAVEKPLVVQQYLEYADWAAKMNFVRQAGTLYPEVRLAVNKALLERDRLPTTVRLQLDGEAPVQKQAQHTFHWSLGSIGQSVIGDCEHACSSKDTRWVDFLDYQRSVMTATARK